MDKLLTNKLETISDILDHKGFEEALLELGSDDFADLEQMLNTEITNENDDRELQHLLRLRMMFRVLCKFSGDINTGATELRKYERQY
jgi:hypothetical protein